MLPITLVVLVIGQGPTDPSTIALERAMRGALGHEASVRIETLPEDPPDAESAARGVNADGVVELLWSRDRKSARIHCFLSREGRWLDREISFGTGRASAEREATERGRLLGFAVATMFVEATEPEKPDSDVPSDGEQPTEPAPAAPATQRPRPESTSPKELGYSSNMPSGTSSAPEEPSRSTRSTASRLSVEFAGIASAGLGGKGGGGSGLGASAGLRVRWAGPLSARLFVAGRTGNLPPAQATTRLGLLGSGLSLSLLPERTNIELRLRADILACYLEARHLSEDEVTGEEVVRGRWLPGADLVAEGGFHLGGKTSVYAGIGLEALAGETQVYTHQELKAVIPLLLLVGEVGLRTHF